MKPLMTQAIDRKIRQSRTKLENPYSHLNGEGGFDALVGENAREIAAIRVAQVFKGRVDGRVLSRKELESTARNLHRLIWERRLAIFGTDEVDPREILNPELALKALGYGATLHDSLGQHAGGRDSFEVAGIVDKENREVRISRRFGSASRNFTTAHELGHVLLHESSGLHRDRAPDGSAIGQRDPQEAEADIFATFFLLPEKQIRPAFKKRFLVDCFEPTDATAFALISGSLTLLQSKCRTKRELARMLASAQRYNGRHFASLADAFDVSIEMMAIRLEELGLIGVK
jgi:Zn-dependent peptidase ImmA (M78 family)